MYKYDGFKHGPLFERHLIEFLLAAPAFFYERIAYDTWVGCETWVEVEGDVRPWFGTATTCQVHMEPGHKARTFILDWHHPMDTEYSKPGCINDIVE